MHFRDLLCFATAATLFACGGSDDDASSVAADAPLVEGRQRVGTIADVIAAELRKAANDDVITHEEVHDISFVAADVALGSSALYVADNPRWITESYRALTDEYRRFVDGTGTIAFTPRAELELRRRLSIHFRNRQREEGIDPEVALAEAMPVGATRISAPALGFYFFDAVTEIEKYRAELARAQQGYQANKKLGPQWTKGIIENVLALEIHRGRDWIFTNEPVFEAFRDLVLGLAGMGMPLDVGSDDTDESLLIHLAKMGFNGASGRRRAELLGALLDLGATPDYQRLNWSRSSSGGGKNTGPTALIYAVLGNQTFAADAVSALLKHGADPCKRVSGTSYELAYSQVKDEAGYMDYVGAPSSDGSALDYVENADLRLLLEAAGCR